jgi:hypothetical protein
VGVVAQGAEGQVHPRAQLRNQQEVSREELPSRSWSPVYRMWVDDLLCAACCGKLLQQGVLYARVRAVVERVRVCRMPACLQVRCSS